ncbi:MAG: tail fiber domain-containing protein [Bacteroidota bacterium]
MKKILLLLCVIISAIFNAQNVAINSNGAAPAASAMLDVASTTSGLLIPRMTSVQRTAIAAPATGLVVYDTTTGDFWYYNGVIWVQLLNTNSGWALAGNTLAGTEILGSTNAQPVRLFSNNIERMRLTSTGLFGFYTTTPTTWFHFVPSATIGNYQSMWDNSFSGDAVGRTQNLNTANGNRVLLSVTNYNASSFQTPALMGLSLQTAGSGAVGVQGTCNGSAQTGVYAGNQNVPAATTGWALYCNNRAGGATAWVNVSDSRLKKNVNTIQGALAKVNNLRGVEYFFDTEKYNDINLPENKQYGFIAQEVEQVMPEIVSEANIMGNQNLKADNGMSSPAKTYNLKVLSYTYIIPLLVEAVKEQNQKIDLLEKEIKELRVLIKNK